MVDRPIRIERSDEQDVDRGADGGARQVGDRLGAQAEHGFADLPDILDEQAADIDAVERIERGEPFGISERIVDRDAVGGAQLRHQRGRRFRGERMADRLVIAVAAGAVVEGVDFQRHMRVFIPLEFGPLEFGPLGFGTGRAALCGGRGRISIRRPSPAAV